MMQIEMSQVVERWRATEFAPIDDTAIRAIGDKDMRKIKVTMRETRRVVREHRSVSLEGAFDSGKHGRCDDVMLLKRR